LCTLHDRRPTELEQGLFEHVRRLRRVQAVLVVTPLDTPAALAGEEPTRDRDAEREAWTAWELELRRVLNDREVACFPVRRLRSDHLVPIARYLCTKLDSRFQLGFASMVLHQSSRDALVVDLINSLSRTAAFLGLNPIPYADLIAITPVQVLMVCRIAAAYGRRISVRWAADFVAVCAAVAGTGLGFKMLYRRIKKGLGNPGLPLLMPLGAGVAWVGTQVIGHAARLYFQSSGGMSARQAGRKAAQLVAEQSVVGMLLVQ
ncbi:MAG: hypothetical protein HUU35_14955, partial [Armatimonadetes bacterium]|nr:hypothetical protein [Armatimonadota bacterium]